MEAVSFALVQICNIATRTLLVIIMRNVNVCSRHKKESKVKVMLQVCTLTF